MSDVSVRFPELTVVRDGDFANLGMATDDERALLCFAAGAKYVQQSVRNVNVSCLLVTPELADSAPGHFGVALSADPKMSFYRLHNFLREETDFYGKDRPTSIATTARIHPTAFVADKNVIIGERVVLEPHVCILEHVTIEPDVIIRAGSTVGSEGFEFKRTPRSLVAVGHAGSVLVRRGVEIQANCCVSRSVFRRPTELGAETKLDNLVHIAHNVKIGSRCLFAAGVTVAGSVTFGDDVWIGPGAVISNGIRIGDRAKITLGSVVVKDVGADQQVSGNFALPHHAFLTHWIDSHQSGRHAR